MATLDELLQQLGFGGVTRNRAGQIVTNTNDVVPGAMAGLADTLYGAGRGTLAGTAAVGGIPGDINQMYVNKFGALFPSQPAPPTSEQISQAVKRAVPPLNLSRDNTGRVATSLGENVVSPMVAPESLLGAARATKGLPVGMSIKEVKQSGLIGTPYQRSLEQGYEQGWYHGTTGDVKEFRPDLLGEATGAASAKQGFFFARDPIAPPKEMTQKSSDPDSIAFLKRLGKTNAEIEAMNTISMKGHGANQASGYAQVGGSREYREAMRKAAVAEKNKNWPEYEKQTQIAEDLEIGRMNQAQTLVAKHGEARDLMLSKVENASPEIKKNMGYGWYNNPAQLELVRKEYIKELGKDKAADVVNAIDKYKSLTAERMALDVQSGANVIPAALRYKNPMVYDFKGSAYRDQTYNDLVSEARAKGHDALILRNTFDPGAGTAKLIDVGVVFDPGQIRSKFAQFDPAKLGKPDLVAEVVPLGLLGQEQLEMKKEKKPKK
jgi:hypothetical protein